METFLLFTYGTLMRGQYNQHLLAGAKYLGKAKTKPLYRLFDLKVFPALIDEGNVSISGEVYECPMDLLRKMDYVEGHPNFYCRKTIELDGDFHNVIAYFFVDKNMLFEDYSEVKTGDWLNQ